MNIPDEAVQAALKEWHDAWNENANMDDKLSAYAMKEALTAALPHLQPVDVAAVTRPVANIESRKPKEVFDIMCDRILALSAEPALKGQQHDK